ncbi:hypothetical protein [Streptomyces sp. NPDC087297]
MNNYTISNGFLDTANNRWFGALTSSASANPADTFTVQTVCLPFTAAP